MIDDFAHHPTAVRETIAAIRGRYPGRRLWAVFEPRSNTSRRNIHQEDYAHAFAGAVCVRVRVPEPHDKVPADERLDVDRLAAALQAQGIDAAGTGDVDALVADVAREARPGDVVLVMSNGAFGGFVARLPRRAAPDPELHETLRRRETPLTPCRHPSPQTGRAGSASP